MKKNNRHLVKRSLSEKVLEMYVAGYLAEDLTVGNMITVFDIVEHNIDGKTRLKRLIEEKCTRHYLKMESLMLPSFWRIINNLKTVTTTVISLDMEEICVFQWNCTVRFGPNCTQVRLPGSCLNCSFPSEQKQASTSNFLPPGNTPNPSVQRQYPKLSQRSAKHNLKSKAKYPSKRSPETLKSQLADPRSHQVAFKPLSPLFGLNLKN